MLCCDKPRNLYAKHIFVNEMECDNYSKIIYAHFTANRFGYPAGGPQFLQQANGAMLVQPRF